MLDLIYEPIAQAILGGFLANGLFTKLILLTPTKKDDNILSKIQPILLFFTGAGSTVKDK